MLYNLLYLYCFRIKLRIKTDKSQFEESNQTSPDKDKENTEKLKVCR